MKNENGHGETQLPLKPPPNKPITNSMDRAQKTVRSTDYDALSCRLSAAQKKYFADEYIPNIISGLEKFLKFEYKLSSKRIFNSIVQSSKLPIINRGTFIRTLAVDTIVERFVKNFDGAVRIVSLGAGSDTRSFRALKEYKNVEYLEFDFNDSTKLKAATIKTDEILAKIVGLEVDNRDLETIWNDTEPVLELERYKLYGTDLRKIDQFEAILKTLDTSVPTLVISECMLCYTESSESTMILKTLRETFDKIALVIYDPIGGEDNFGNIMIENLKIRSIRMPSLLEFNTLEKYSDRLQNLGYERVKSDHMYNIISNWISDSEKTRISRLELLDEIEELKLLLEHYCTMLAYNGFEWSNITDLKFQISR